MPIPKITDASQVALVSSKTAKTTKAASLVKLEKDRKQELDQQDLTKHVLTRKA